MNESGHRSGDFRNDINGLRALGVALVVLFHIELRGSGGGFIGVDVFFVVSGYLMTQIIGGGLHKGSFSYWRFIEARAARIWPALGVMVLALLALGAFLLPPSDLELLSSQSVDAVLFWSNQVIHDHVGYNTQGIDGNWLLHTWSLSVEWQFYMVYPLLLMAAVRLASRRTVSVDAPPRSPILWPLLALFTASLAVHLLQSSMRPNSAFFLLPARAWEMAAGGLAHALGPSSPRATPIWRAGASYAGLTLIVASALWFGYVHLDPVGSGWHALVPVAGAMLVLWSAHSNNLFLRLAWVQKIGLWSYSIYLWHWPLVVAAAISGMSYWHPWAAKVMVVAGSIVLGWLSFVWVESTTRRKPAEANRLRFVKPVVALAAAGAASMIVASIHGLDFRMPHDPAEPEVTQALESDYFPARCDNFKKNARDLTVCHIPNDGERKVLVIGDSLAENFYPWFLRHSKVAVDFLTGSECPPVPNFDRLQNGFDCLGYARKAWTAAASPRYDTVIIKANWPMVGGIGPAYCHADAQGVCTTVRNGPGKQELVRAELRTAIRSLLAQGKRVVVMDDAPTAPFKVPQRLERERFWFGEIRLSIPVASVTERSAWIDSLWAELEGTPGFHRVSLRPVLCDASTCRVYDPQLKRPIYIDESHFDPVWIAQHGDIFAPFVQDARAP